MGKVWQLNIPEGLKEVLWKEMNSALVIGHRYHGVSDMGRFCRCRAELSLGHIFTSCTDYGQQGLMSQLITDLQKVGPALTYKMLRPDEWGVSGWYPLLALSALEVDAVCPSKALKKPNKAMKDTRPMREWLIGSYLWMLWKWRMKEIHAADFVYRPGNCEESLRRTLATKPPERYPVRNSAQTDRALKAKNAKTDGAYT